MAADPYASIAHDPYASMAQSSVVSPSSAAPAPAKMTHVTTPFANAKAKPMFDTRGIENAMDDAKDQVGEAGKHLGGTALDLMGRPGQAGVALAARGPKAAGDAFIHGGAPTQDKDMAIIRHKLPFLEGYDKTAKPGMEGLHHAGQGMIDAGIQSGLDPTTLLGGSGLIENLANKLGRLGYVGLAKGLAQANPVSRAAATVHDFVTPGGSAAGAAKRTITAQQGEAGLDKYLGKKADLKAAANKAPEAAPAEVHGPATINSNAFAISPNKQARFAPQVGMTGGKPHIKAGDIAKAVAKAKAAKDDALLADVGKSSPPLLGGGLADIAGIGKKATKGTTSLMFATPQLPGMEGHGSNILQTAFMSDPGAALGGTARYLASGEPIPGAGLRGAYQKLPGVRGLVKAQDAASARAKATGALTETPEKDPGFLDKIPGVKQLADYSSRTLWGYDDAMKGALNDAHTKNYLASGLDPKIAKARATDRVGQDIVDYGDKSDMTKALSYALPFATYATKKPGVIARAAARHPERVLALTRNNPNYSPDRDEPMSYPDNGRPLASITNALNNKSPGAKAQGPFPGSQYLRASAGAPVNDLMGLANPYFTYGPPGKHADGDTMKGIAKLLLSQSLGNVTGGEQLLDAIGMNYFGGK